MTGRRNWKYRTRRAAAPRHDTRARGRVSAHPARRVAVSLSLALPESPRARTANYTTRTSRRRLAARRASHRPGDAAAGRRGTIPRHDAPHLTPEPRPPSALALCLSCVAAPSATPPNLHCPARPICMDTLQARSNPYLYTADALRRRSWRLTAPTASRVARMRSPQSAAVAIASLLRHLHDLPSSSARISFWRTLLPPLWA